MASIAALSPSPAAISPFADAAPPSRNGPIVISVMQPPFSELPAEQEGNGAEDRDVFTVSVGGVGIQRVTTGSGSDANPRWSPDGSQIVFARTEVFSVGTVSDLYMVNADGTGERSLTNTPEYHENWPVLSPDGRRILFSSDRGNPDFDQRLVRVTPETDLYVMDADGSNLTRLTSESGREIHGVWSPDGRWIVFVQGNNQLTLIASDGSDPRVLLRQGEPLGPDWSPDGTKIAFWDDANRDIWVVNPSGHGLRRLTSGASNDAYPSWSPDGRWIAFTSDRDGAWKLYKMRPDGSHISTIVDIDLKTPFSTPDWGPRP